MQGNEEMEIIFEFLTELFLEIFAEGFVAICSAFVPKKMITEKSQKIIRYICLVVSILLFIGLLIGIAILTETNGKNFWGWLLISLTIIYLFVGITLKIISCIKK